MVMNFSKVSSLIGLFPGLMTIMASKPASVAASASEKSRILIVFK
jgi:hypothetical protein